MSMNHKTPLPGPRPLCALFTPRLSLLVLNQLDAEEAAEVQAHLAECDHCQLRLREYEMLRGALHRHFGADPSVGPAPLAPTNSFAGRIHSLRRSESRLLTLEDIMRAAKQQDQDALPPASHQPPRRPDPSPRKQTLTALGAIAAVLVAAVLAASLFASFGSRHGGPPARPAAGQVTEFRIPTADSSPGSITRGPDGNLWFAEFYANQIGRITPAGQITEFRIPTANSFPVSITRGPDGNLWFTEHLANRIGRITPAGQITEFRINAGRLPIEITRGPDDALWFTESSDTSGGGWIGRITPAGQITDFAIPTVDSGPESITIGPDGNLWFTETNGRLKIGQITPAGQITEFPLPEVPPPNASQWEPCSITCLEIASGPDGNLWFTEGSTDNKIGQITPAGQITEFPLPRARSYLEGITSGPDGNLWFTEQAGKIGRITPAGRITEFPVPTANSDPLAITAGPDGAVWFTEAGSTDTGGNKIGRITP